MSSATRIIGALLLILLIALFIPVLIDAPTADASQSLQLAENESASVAGEPLVNVSVDSVTPDNATIAATNTETLQSHTAVIQVGSNETFQFAPGNVTVSISDTSGDTATLTASWSQMFGWGDGPKLIAHNLPLILTAMAVVIIGGVIVVIGP